jgi:glucose-6-phosphate dehydrogenase assembly protein OpcA
MVTTSSPLISLQSPKDVSLSEITAELGKIWTSNNASDGGSFPAATRAATFTLVVYEPQETQQLLAALGFYQGPVDGILGPRMEVALRSAQEAYGLEPTGKATPAFKDKLKQALAEQKASSEQASVDYVLDASGSGLADAIASQNPCRVITLCPIAGEDEGVKAQVSAYCPIKKQKRSSLICCEYITLSGTETALARAAGLIQSLMIGGLPKFLWWKDVPNSNPDIFHRLGSACNAVIVDSSDFDDAATELVKLQSLVEEGHNIADLNWRRLSAWQELTAEAFDPPERRSALLEVDKVTLDYEKGNPAQAFMFLGWLASRLQWHPIAVESEGGDYDLKRIKFTNQEQRLIEAELAAVPVGDVGDVAGDLIDLKLASTNLQADCCTVLCSETRGCMRMEAGGGAQSCRIQHVTPLLDQSAETLLSQQLQRWDQDVLYNESLVVTAQILRLNHGGV